MSQLDQLTQASHKTRHYRKILIGAQVAMAGGLVAKLLFPSIEIGAVVAGCLALMAIQHSLWAVLRKRSADLIRMHKELLIEAEGSRRRTEELFEMTDLLQSTENHVDAGAVLRTRSLRLLPTFSGALYVFSNSQDRLDLAVSWSLDRDFAPAETLVPENCWALKRGKLHINDSEIGTLCCTHHWGGLATMEIPMIARGTVYGLLMLATSEGTDSLKRETRIARALADSTSLALSNIALQDKLRAQSLRDPLTGLYNRRYMEDALDRCLSMAERNGEPISVIMIDLDHFKDLNDEHGHAKGDAVLKDAASQLVGALRPADVVSRYGGEEILVILPGCPLENAVLKAEVLRGRIESLSGLHGCAVSASFGVASVPQTSAGRADLIPMADAALYEAKQAGRNCVRAAVPRAPRSGPEAAGPRLAVG